MISIATANGYGMNQKKGQNAQTEKRTNRISFVNRLIIRQERLHKGKSFLTMRIKRRKARESLLCTNGGAIMLTAKSELRCWQN